MPATEAFTIQTVECAAGMARVRLIFKRLEALNAEKQQHPLYGMMHTADFKALVLNHTAHHFLQFGLF